MKIEDKTVAEIMELAMVDCGAVNDICGVPVCRWHCMPCAKAILDGKCLWMQTMAQGGEKDDRH